MKINYLRMSISILGLSIIEISTARSLSHDCKWLIMTTFTVDRVYCKHAVRQVGANVDNNKNALQFWQSKVAIRIITLYYNESA